MHGEGGKGAVSQDTASQWDQLGSKVIDSHAPSSPISITWQWSWQCSVCTFLNLYFPPRKGAKVKQNEDSSQGQRK